MSEIKDIKDMTPNPDLVAMLKRLLADAESGELRSHVGISGWDDDSTTTNWVLDDRTNPRKMLAQMVMTEHDLVVKIGFQEGNTVLSKAFEDV